MQIGSGTIIFGKSRISVGLHPATSAGRSSFGRFHRACGNRLTHRFSCPKHGQVDRNEAERRLEYTPGQWITVSDVESETLEREATGDIKIEEFAPLYTVSSIRFAPGSYWLTPNEGSRYDYFIFKEALESSNLFAGGAYDAKGKSFSVLLSVSNEGLLMRAIHRDHELNAPPPVTKEKLDETDRELARQAIDRKLRQAPSFDYPNRWQERLERWIASKV